MENILEVSGLTKKYKHFLLDQVSFNIPAGSVMGLVGKNGAGKTTIIKAILNIVKMDQGQIKLFGKNLKESETEIKQDIGTVLEECYFHEVLNTDKVNSIMKNVYRNWDQDLYFSMTDQFKLPKGQKLKEFSRGMRMKLSTAVALAHRPRLLILDEATSGLDPVARNSALDTYRQFMQDEDHGILISSHITGDLEKIADYITCIDEGKIIFSQSINDLLYDYGVLRCNSESLNTIDKQDILGAKQGEFGHELLIKNKSLLRQKYPKLIIDDSHVEEIMLFYLKEDA